MVSVIAIGSNSIRQLVLDNEGRKHNYRIENQLFLKLDSELGFSEKAILETLNALLELSKNCDDNFSIIATSAMRDAKNSAELIKRVKESLNKDILIISGEEEAYYSYLGASLPYSEPIGLIDIGGGSTELAVSLSKKVKKPSDLRLISLQLGASRLYKLCPLNSREDIEKASKIVDESLKEIELSFDGPFVLLGGTGTALARIYKKESNREGDFLVSLEEIKALLYKLADMDVEERANIEGLPKTRLNIFPTGLLILYRLLLALNKVEVIVSRRSNMDGLLSI